MPLKRRQKIILAALEELGGEATTKQIAEKVSLHTNGVAQSLSAMSPKYVKCLGGRAGATKWQLRHGHLIQSRFI
jgi:signal recognition particle receptor subunit beta